MKRRMIVAAAVLAMIALVAAAVAWDSVRIAGNHRARIRLASNELQKHEARLVTLLSGSPHVSSDVSNAIATYQGAAEARDFPRRLAAYDELVAAFRRTMSPAIDPTNPLERKFMDDTAGAINRRDVARDPYDLEIAEYRQYLDSVRGRVARWFSKQAAADYAFVAK